MLEETATYAPVTVRVAIKVKKAANPFELAKATRTVTASKVRKASATVSSAKVVRKAKGKVAYFIVKAVKGSKNVKRYFAIDKAKGKITVRKDTPAGTYKVTVRANAKGSANYKAASRTAVITIKVA